MRRALAIKLALAILFSAWTLLIIRVGDVVKREFGLTIAVGFTVLGFVPLIVYVVNKRRRHPSAKD